MNAIEMNGCTGNDEPARLTVSSQLGLEALVPGMGPVYTTNPSYRAVSNCFLRYQVCVLLMKRYL